MGTNEATSLFHSRDLPGAENEMSEILSWDTGEVTVTGEADGTFMVRIDGEMVGRWPSQEIAEKRAANIRSHQPADPASIRRAGSDDLQLHKTATPEL